MIVLSVMTSYQTNVSQVGLVFVGASFSNAVSINTSNIGSLTLTNYNGGSLTVIGGGAVALNGFGSTVSDDVLVISELYRVTLSRPHLLI